MEYPHTRLLPPSPPIYDLPSCRDIRSRFRKRRGRSAHEPVRQSIDTAFSLSRIYTSSVDTSRRSQASSVGRTAHWRSNEIQAQQREFESIHLLENAGAVGRFDLRLGYADGSEQEYHDAVRAQSGRSGASSRLLPASHSHASASIEAPQHAGQSTDLCRNRS